MASDGGEEGTPSDLRCTSCGRRVKTAVWSETDRHFIHAARVRMTRRGAVICGGRLASEGDEWTATLERDDVVLCHPTVVSLMAHFVRLQRPTHRKSGSWSGTPLCGRTTRRRCLWVPVRPEVRGTIDVCPDCGRLHAVTAGS